MSFILDKNGNGVEDERIMREISIYGKMISNAIGYCHYDRHKGALNRDIAYKHKCIAKKCKYLEKYNEESWNRKPSYRNRRK